MKTSKPNKKKIILILWGFLFSIIVIVFLTILLLSSQTKPSNKQEPVSNVKTNSQQEQETYNRLMSKIEKEIDDLTKPKFRYSQKVTYYDDGKTIRFVDELNKDTGQLIKTTEYDKNGNILSIEEYQNQFLIKETYFNPDGTIKEIKTY